MRIWWLVATMAGCNPETSPGTVPADACSLVDEDAACPPCTDGPYTCSYGDTTVEVSNSCGECDARVALYTALCDAGENDFADTIEALTVCAPITCEVRYACDCTPSCALSTEPEETCAEVCATPEPPPGDCVRTGETCDWAP